MDLQKIYYVNTEKRVDRRERMEKRFSQWFEPTMITRWNALPPDDPHVKEVIDSKELDPNVTNNIYACCVSHMDIWKDILENETYPEQVDILIFEDDVLFGENWIQRLNDNLKLIQEKQYPIDIFMLDSIGPMTDVNKIGLFKIKNETLTSAYLIRNKQVLRDLLNLFDKSEKFITAEELIYNIQKRETVFGAMPRLCIQEPNNSDLQNDFHCNRLITWYCEKYYPRYIHTYIEPESIKPKFNWVFLKGVDQFGEDLFLRKMPNVKRLIDIANLMNGYVVAFNTLGYFKKKITSLVPLKTKIFNPDKDGIFVRKDVYDFYLRQQKEAEIKVKKELENKKKIVCLFNSSYRTWDHEVTLKNQHDCLKQLEKVNDGVLDTVGAHVWNHREFLDVSQDPNEKLSMPDKISSLFKHVKMTQFNLDKENQINRMQRSDLFLHSFIYSLKYALDNSLEVNPSIQDNDLVYRFRPDSFVSFDRNTDFSLINANILNAPNFPYVYATVGNTAHRPISHQDPETFVKSSEAPDIVAITTPATIKKLFSWIENSFSNPFKDFNERALKFALLSNNVSIVYLNHVISNLVRGQEGKIDKLTRIKEPKVHVVSFASEGLPHDNGLPLKECLDVFLETCKKEGQVDSVSGFTPSMIKELFPNDIWCIKDCYKNYENYINITYHKIGNGCWRAFLIYRCLLQLQDGDILFFHDCNYKKTPQILDVAKNAKEYALKAASLVQNTGGIFSSPHLSNGHFIKHDLFKAILGSYDQDVAKVPGGRARSIVMIASDETRTFAKEFLELCKMYQETLMTPEPSVEDKENKNFSHNTYEQGVFNLLAFKKGYFHKDHEWFKKFGQEGINPDSGLSVIREI